jgi:hypothetical protein
MKRPHNYRRDWPLLLVALALLLAAYGVGAAVGVWAD